MKEIKIAGAGPSGLAAAINLAKAGYPVKVFERGRDCGCRFLGDMQGLENWSSKVDVCEDLKSMGLKINFDCDPFDKLTLTNGKEMLSVTFKKPFFYVVKRGTGAGFMDQGLKRQAIDLGVEILFGRTAREEDADIVATGPRAKNITGVDKGIVFETDMEDTAIVMADKEVASNGYSYMMVKKGYACLCTVLVHNFGAINVYFNKTKKAFQKLFDFKIKNEHNAGGVGSIFFNRDFEKEGRLYVGESAGLQDALGGFGIRSAITSGYIAAKSITDGSSYAKLVHARFDAYLKAGAVNRFLWDKSSSDNYRTLWKYAHGVKDYHKFMFEMYNYAPLQRLLYPLALRYAKINYSKAFNS